MRGSAAARLLAGIAVSNPVRGLSLVSVAYYHVDVSTSGLSLVQRCPIECGVPEIGPEATERGGPGPVGAVVPWRKINK
jgi:hypothetical protein